MSYLLGDDYASSSSSESESEGETSIEIHEKKTRLGDDADQEKKPVTQRMPSADSVLSAVSASTASFLPLNRSVKLQSSVESFDLTAEQRSKCQLQEKKKERQQWGQEEIECVADRGRNDRKRLRPTEEPATREPLMTRERKDAKGRVKNQRVKGQAGIGPDFRSWKSETEMALRQQFD
uniref:Uncharacterized protein n=1 Tax=Hyaloperonospora arabidopsidis (strain Emoy2) TaxID=559515 RepID=M4BHH7_HYAAE